LTIKEIAMPIAVGYVMIA